MIRRLVGVAAGKRGMALLLVVTVISLLTIVILQFNRSMRHHLTGNYYFSKRGQLSALAESGLDLAIAVLVSDSDYNDYDCLLDPWAKVNENPVGDLGGGSELFVSIIDLSGRFQVNTLAESVKSGSGSDNSGITPEQARVVFKRLLLSGEFAVEDELQADEIIDAVVDWIDADDIDSDNGAESSYYETLDPPYRPRNGVMITPNELLDVRGITPEILYGNNEKRGLADYITVYGDGSGINLNTADALVIQALDERIGSEEAELLIEYRQDPEIVDSLTDRNWYRNVSGWPGDISIDADLLKTESSFFLVETEALMDTDSIRAVAYIKRTEKGEIEILFRTIE